MSSRRYSTRSHTSDTSIPIQTRSSTDPLAPTTATGQAAPRRRDRQGRAVRQSPSGTATTSTSTSADASSRSTSRRRSVPASSRNLDRRRVKQEPENQEPDESAPRRPRPRVSVDGRLVRIAMDGLGGASGPGASSSRNARNTAPRDEEESSELSEVDDAEYGELPDVLLPNQRHTRPESNGSNTLRGGRAAGGAIAGPSRMTASVYSGTSRTPYNRPKSPSEVPTSVDSDGHGDSDSDYKPRSKGKEPAGKGKGKGKGRASSSRTIGASSDENEEEEMTGRSLGRKKSQTMGKGKGVARRKSSGTGINGATGSSAGIASGSGFIIDEAALEVKPHPMFAKSEPEPEVEVIADMPKPKQKRPLPEADDTLAAYSCPICFSSLEKPVMTLCGHLLCSKCLLDALLAALKRNPDPAPGRPPPGRGRGRGRGGAAGRGRLGGLIPYNPDHNNQQPITHPDSHPIGGPPAWTAEALKQAWYEFKCRTINSMFPGQDQQRERDEEIEKARGVRVVEQLKGLWLLEDGVYVVEGECPVCRKALPGGFGPPGTGIGGVIPLHVRCH